MDHIPSQTTNDANFKNAPRTLQWIFIIFLQLCLVYVVVFLIPSTYDKTFLEITNPTYGINRSFTKENAINMELYGWHKFLPEDGNCLPNFFIKGNSVESKRRYRDGVIGFQHLNKAGGQTTRQCIKKLPLIGQSKVHHLISAPQRMEVEAHIAFGTLTTDNIDIFHGDYFFGLCNRLPRTASNRSCSYFTLVRDPYERVISSYYFCQSNPYDQTCGPFLAKNFTVEEWAVKQGSYFFYQLLQKPEYCKMGDQIQNEFTEIISHHLPKSGIFGFPHQCWYLEKVILENSMSHDDRRELLNYLVNNLENMFAVIGLSDMIIETFSLLQEVYQLPFKNCKSRAVNIGPRSKNHGLYTRLKRTMLRNPTVTDALKEDVALYERSVEIFNEEMYENRNKRTGEAGHIDAIITSI